jgi:hypothetical protein
VPPLAPLAAIGSLEFAAAAVIALIVMAAVAWLDGWMSRAESSRLAGASIMDRPASLLAPHAMRLGLAAFFCAAALHFKAGPVYLAPELRSGAAWVPLLQLAIAAALVRRSTAWLGALGIAVLYAAATAAYGWFQLFDYPLLLGAAASVAIDSLGQGRRTDNALAVLRVSAAVTLMWAGAEKWLYPGCSAGVLGHELSLLRGPMSASFFMTAAGWVEFCAAYVLMFGRRATQCAAAFLLLVSCVAIPIFGTLDGMGETPIIVVLAVLATTRTSLPAPFQGALDRAAPLRRAVSCAFAGLAVVGLYGSLQASAYSVRDGGQALVALLLAAPLLAWWLPRLRQPASARMFAAGRAATA